MQVKEKLNTRRYYNLAPIDDILHYTWAKEIQALGEPRMKRNEFLLNELLIPAINLRNALRDSGNNKPLSLAVQDIINDLNNHTS